MENKKQFNLGTILLLAIGSIFVAVAAVIFVVKAWPYLNHLGKSLLMIAATAGCFGLSVLVDRKLAIRGSASAMYYLGTVLSGITMMAIIDDNVLSKLTQGYGLTTSTAEYIQALMVFGVMLVPMSIRLVKQRRGIDCIFSVALLDAIVFVLTDLITDDFVIMSVIFCLVHSMILFAYERLKATEEKSLLLGLKIVVMVHAVFYFIIVQFAGMINLLLEEGLTAVILVLVLAASVAVMYWYYTRNKSILSLIATLAGLFCLAMGVAFVEIPFIPDVIEVERALLTFAIAIWLMKPIFAVRSEKAEAVLKHVRFALNCLLMLILLCYNIEVDELINVLILGVVGAVMLFWSVFKNDIRYIILSSVTLVLMVLYMTRDLWMSISWWVYLMIAGIVMIVVAVIRERRAGRDEGKTKKEEIEE